MPRTRPDRAPGRAGARVVAIAAACAALAAVAPAGESYWLCVPAALAAATQCRRLPGVILVTALVLVAAGAPTLARAHGPRRPALWIALVAPIASVAVAQVTRRRLERERDGLRDFALTDPLTRVANRRLLLVQTEHELARHRRTRRPFTLVMLDLDGFKALNDRFGHDAGDDLLRDVAAALTRAMRAQDTVARLGGDEFCVLAPETDHAGAQRLLARVTGAVAAVAAGMDHVRASAGAAVFPADGTDAAALMRVADDRLLAAKRERHAQRPARRAA